MRIGKRLWYLPEVTMAHIRNIGGAFGRVALVGLWLLLSPQLVMQGWAGEETAGAKPSPLQGHEQLPGEHGETEELTEDSDDRFAWQAEMAGADATDVFPDTSTGTAFRRPSYVYRSLLDRSLLRPPTGL